MKLKKSLISTLMVSAIVVGGAGAVFASDNSNEVVVKDDIKLSTSKTVESLEQFKSIDFNDPATLAEYGGVQYYTYDEYAKEIEQLKEYAKAGGEAQYSKNEDGTVKDKAFAESQKKELEEVIKKKEQDLEKIKTEGKKIMKPITIDFEDGTQAAVVMADEAK